MAEMRRITITVPDEVDQKVAQLRKDERFLRCSYSKIIRQMLDLGLRSYEKEKQPG